ncbi:hypothetical protein Tco_0538205 [Tanacetum coccineum]
MCETPRHKVPELTVSTTNDLMKESLLKMVTDAVNQERESSQAVVSALISQELATHAPKIIEELFRIHMQDTVLNDVLKAKFEKSLASGGSCKDDAFYKHGHDEHQGDDAPLEGEKSAKRQKTSKDWDAWVDTPVIDEDEVIPEDETLKLIDEFQNVDKRVPTIFDRERMEDTIKYMLSNQFRDVEEYAYHLEQAQNYLENQIVWESRQEDLKRPKPYALVFYKGTRMNLQACDPFSIVNKSTTGLIYLNIKNEKIFMDLEELLKFCDATLEKVLKEVKMKIFETKFLKKAPLLGNLDLKIIKAYEREIMKRLSITSR